MKSVYERVKDIVKKYYDKAPHYNGKKRFKRLYDFIMSKINYSDNDFNVLMDLYNEDKGITKEYRNNLCVDDWDKFCKIVDDNCDWLCEMVGKSINELEEEGPRL